MTEIFSIHCPRCEAKVRVVAQATLTRDVMTRNDYFAREQYLLGECPACHSVILASRVEVPKAEEPFFEWSECERLYPEPPKALSSFASERIPASVRNSLAEGRRLLNANAATAACAMFGRTLEAICRDQLSQFDMTAKEERKRANQQDRFNFEKAIDALRENGIIDDMLYDYCEQLKVFRNLAAHASDVTFTLDDAKHLEPLLHAIIEYVYNLRPGYEEIKKRASESR